MDPLPIDVANLAGLFTGSVLYGVFFVLFLLCLHTLLYRRNSPSPNYVLILGIVCMFSLNTVILGISLSRCLDAFIFGPNQPGGPGAYFEDLASWKEVTRTALILCYAALADVILIYRCWVVWDRRIAVIVVPILLLLGSICMDILVVATLVSLSSTPAYASTLIGRTTAALSIILVQNVLATTLIVYRIRSLARSQLGRAVGDLQPIIDVVVESGLVFVATILVFLITYATGSNAQFIMVDAINPMIGITVSLLTIRVSYASPFPLVLPQPPACKPSLSKSKSLLREKCLPPIPSKPSSKPKTVSWKLPPYTKKLANSVRSASVIDIGPQDPNAGKGWNFWDDDLIV